MRGRRSACSRTRTRSECVRKSPCVARGSSARTRAPPGSATLRVPPRGRSILRCFTSRASCRRRTLMCAWRCSFILNVAVTEACAGCRVIHAGVFVFAQLWNKQLLPVRRKPGAHALHVRHFCRVWRCGCAPDARQFFMRLPQVGSFLVVLRRIRWQWPLAGRG